MKKDIAVVLDNVRSALNVGAILRTCDGAGVLELYLCGITPQAGHPRVKKTAIGAENSVQTSYYSNTRDAINILKKKGFQICAVEQSQNAKPVNFLENFTKLALIFGNEIAGVAEEIVELSDITVELPMKGKKNSLNIATTVGIVLYYLILNE